MRRIGGIGGALLLAAVALAGCDSSRDNEGWQPNQTMRDTLPAAATPADSSAGLTVTLTEWNVRLARDTVPPGIRHFRARNIGELKHVLAVQGGGGEWQTDTIPPGGWAALDVDLRPGTYTVYCPLDTDRGDHSRLGMQTYLAVLPEGGSATVGSERPRPGAAEPRAGPAVRNPQADAEPPDTGGLP